MRETNSHWNFFSNFHENRKAFVKMWILFFFCLPCARWAFGDGVGDGLDDNVGKPELLWW